MSLNTKRLIVLTALLLARLSLFCLLLCCLFSCAGGAKSVQKAKPVKKSSPGKVEKKLLGLKDFVLKSGPIKIKKISGNASGLTFNPLTKSLFLVINGPTKILELELNGKLKRVIQLKGFSDTEAIVHIENDLFAIAEEGRFKVVFITIDKETRMIDYSKTKYIPLETKTGGNQGLEGLGYDKRQQVFYSVKEKKPRKIYSFRKSKTPNIKMPWDFEKRNFNLRDLSALHYHENTGHLLILSHESRSLIESTIDGKELSRLSLKKGSAGLKENIPQAEGVTMDNKETLYICSEPNLLYIFEKK